MATYIGSTPIGSTVKIRVNGVAEEFLVVQQGRPSSLYDASCDGTWLLMKDVYSVAPWSTNGNDYAGSNIYTYLNSTFYSLIDSNVRDVVKQVKIPYQKGMGSSGSLATGSSGLSSKVFLLSAYEIGLTTSINPYIPQDGTKLSFFDSGSGSSAKSKRIARNGSSATEWITRSAFLYNASDVWYIKNDGSEGLWYFNNQNGIRPCIILPRNVTLTDDGELATNNTAPTTPGSITVPASIMDGNSFAVQWEKSTDPDGNLAGYILERSTDGGSTWIRVYQGTSLTVTHRIAPSQNVDSILFRVKAYDDEGLESGYKISTQVTIVHNDPPGACPSISVPVEISAGGVIEVSWTASTDPDGNLEGYILERSVDGGSSWAQVYKGANLKYNDTAIKGWASVRYRVKAYDAYNAQSNYTVSEARTVNNNTAPVISCSASSNLGTKAGGFSISYSVMDADAEDTISVTEQIDGVTKRTFTPARGASNAFAVTGDYFQKLSNGAHTLTITATDGKAMAKREFSFTKQVTVVTITLSSPLIATDEIRVLRLNIAGDIPADADLQVLATNNAKDSSPVWEDATQAVRGGRNHVFENTTQTNGWALNFKLTVKRGASGIGGIITKVEGAFGSSASGNSGGGSVNLTIGTVTSGSTASATIEDGKLNLVLPKGETGEKGETGSQGPKGDPGDIVTASGLSKEERTLLLALLKSAAYTSDEMSENYTALKKIWDPESGDGDVAVQSVSFAQTSGSLEIGKSLTLVPVITPSNATDKTVTWKSSKPAVASVENGLVKALTAGSAEITATVGGKTATYALTVLEATTEDETLVYSLPEETVFDPSAEKYIDTGVKLFESIEEKPSWTLLMEVQYGENVDTSSTYCLAHCMEESSPWPGLSIASWADGSLGVNVYGGKSQLGTMAKLKAQKRRLALKLEGTTGTRWNVDGGSTTFTISNYNTAVNKTLILGAYQTSDGEKGRYFDGTLSKFLVYKKAMGDEDITAWLNE